MPDNNTPKTKSNPTLKLPIPLIIQILAIFVSLAVVYGGFKVVLKYTIRDVAENKEDIKEVRKKAEKNELELTGLKPVVQNIETSVGEIKKLVQKIHENSR